MVLVQLDQLARGEVHDGGDGGRAPAPAIIGHPGTVRHAEGQLPLVGGWGQLKVEHPEEEREEALKAAKDAKGDKKRTNRIIFAVVRTRNDCRIAMLDHHSFLR